MIKFTTKRDASGNRYTIHIFPMQKYFTCDYNTTHDYSDYITLNTKKDREKLINDLLNNGFIEK